MTTARSLALLSLLLALGVAHLASADGSIGFAADAANDLRAWPQLVRKGVAAFLVHVFYLDAPSCKRFGIYAQSGCLILSQSAPVAPDRFNTTSELIAQVQVLAELPEWRAFGGSAHIVLQLRNVPADACNPASDWSMVVGQLYNLATRALHSSVRFVIDTGATTLECLWRRWPSFDFAFVFGVDPAAAYASNNHSARYDRLAVLVSSQAQLAQIAATAYGKFSAPPVTHPYIVRASSADQAALLDAVTAYVNSTSFIPPPAEPPRLCVASTADPILLQVITSSAVPQAAPAPSPAASAGLADSTVPAWNLAFQAGVSAPLTVITELPSSSDFFNENAFFSMTIFTGGDSSVPTFQLSLFFESFSDLPINISQFALPSPAPDFFDAGVQSFSGCSSFTPARTVTFLLTLTFSLQYALFALQYDVDELVLQAAGSLSLPNFQLLTVSAAALVYSNSRSLLFAVQVFSAPYDTSPCAVGVQMWSLPTFQSVEFVPLDAEQVCVFDDVTALGAINSMSVQALEVTADIQMRAGLADCAPGNFLVTASFDQFDPASNTSFVYSAILCLDVDTLALSRSPIDSIHRTLAWDRHSATRVGIMHSNACISNEHVDAPAAASAAFRRSPHRAADYARWACHTTRAARQPSALQRPRIESSVTAHLSPSSTFKATLPRTAPAGGTSSAFPAVGSFLGRESIVALIDVGVVPSVSLLATPSGSAFVAVIHQDGDASCAADTDADTDADADAVTAACDRAPRNSPFALGFNFASLGLWIQQLRSGRLFSSCSADQVYHGVYDFGSAPSVALFPVSLSDNNSTVGLLALHNGMPSNLTRAAASSPRAPPRSSACGSAFAFNGIVLDRFRLWPSADTPRAAPSAAAPIFLWLILGSVSCAALIAFIVVSFVRANRPPHELASDSAADESTLIQRSATLRDYSQL